MFILLERIGNYCWLADVFCISRHSLLQNVMVMTKADILLMCWRLTLIVLLVNAIRADGSHSCNLLSECRRIAAEAKAGILSLMRGLFWWTVLVGWGRLMKIWPLQFIWKASRFSRVLEIDEDTFVVTCLDMSHSSRQNVNTIKHPFGLWFGNDRH